MLRVEQRKLKARSTQRRATMARARGCEHGGHAHACDQRDGQRGREEATSERMPRLSRQMARHFAIERSQQAIFGCSQLTNASRYAQAIKRPDRSLNELAKV